MALKDAGHHSAHSHQMTLCHPITDHLRNSQHANEKMKWLVIMRMSAYYRLWTKGVVI